MNAEMKNSMEGKSIHPEVLELLKPWEPLEQTSKPAFPVDILPGWARDFVSALNRESDSPIDYYAGVMLSVISACVGERGDVDIQGRTQPLILQSLICGKSGTRKSSAFVLTEPFEKWTSEHNKIIDTENAYIFDDIKRIRKRRSDPKLSEDESRKLKDQIRKLKSQIQPRYPYIIGDATPEYIIQAVKNSSGGTALISDEASILNVISGKTYGGVSGTANIDIFLKGYDRAFYLCGRKTDGEVSIHPSVVMCIGVQASLLEKYVSSGDHVGRGVIQRQLYFYPDFDYNAVNPANRRKCPDTLKNKWNRTVTQLLERDRDGFTIEISEAGKKQLNDYEVKNFRLMDKLDNEYYIEWLSKHHDRAARLAGILALLEDPSTHHASDDMVRNAILFCDQYARRMTTYAFGMMNEVISPPLKKLLDSIVDMQTGEELITTGEIWKNIRKRERYYSNDKRKREEKKKQFKQDIAELEQRGFLQTVTVKAGTPGQPPTYVFIHPCYKK